MATNSHDRTTKLLLAAIVLLLAIQAFRPIMQPPAVLAESRFDHISVLASSWLRKGHQGVLLMDRRNGNIWFMETPTQQGGAFGEPDFVVRVPFEKLDQAIGQ